jgi:hypothetical protein
VIVGLNRVFEHGGRQYHIQAEDLGIEQAVFEVRVYDHGTVLWRKQVPYRAVLARALPKIEQDDEIRSLMEKTIHTVEAAIAKGKFSTDQS